MTPFRIIPLETAVARRLRATRVDDHGNPLSPIVADAPGAYPCRHCLCDATPGEAMLLASYSPFKLPGPYKEVGPIWRLTGWRQRCGAVLDRCTREPTALIRRHVTMHP